MTQIDYIRHLRENEGASISEIARRVKCSWKTAKKYADGPAEIRQPARRRRKRPVMEPYEHWIDAWLEEDLRMPRKQRRTAQAMYEALRELGYQGSARTVREYVARKKQQMRERASEQAIRLEHTPGEAQVDFGEFIAINDGKLKTYHLLVMSFPYSNAQVCWALPAENGVCFLYGLQRLFEELGGVPRVIWFDNLSAAVKKVLSGTERDLTDMFSAFKWHYRFQAEFCNPGQGHEKGNVENKVGYTRRNYLTPLPVIDGLEEFNRSLNARMRRDWDRPHYLKGKLISELWQEDAKQLLTLPALPLDIAQLTTAVVNKYGEIKVDELLYHIPTVAPGCRVLVKAYWDRLEVLDEYGEERLYSCPRQYCQRAKDIDWAAELELFIRRPRAVERAVYLAALPEVIKTYILSTTDLRERRDRIKAMVEVLRDHPLEIAEKAAASALEYQRTDRASLKTFAAYEAGVSTPKPLQEPWTPSEVAEWKPDLSAYDILRVVGSK